MPDYVPAPPTKYVFHNQLQKGKIYYIKHSPTELKPVRWLGRTPAGYHLFYYTDPVLRKKTGHLPLTDNEVISYIQEHYNDKMTQKDYVEQGGRF